MLAIGVPMGIGTGIEMLIPMPTPIVVPESLKLE
jgi:hypothetical protein